MSTTLAPTPARPVGAWPLASRPAPADATAALAGGELRYSAVWEDHLLLERALGAAGAGELLVVASAGCNVLNLLVRAPRRVVAIDVNPAQTALLELKLAAAGRLPHDAFLRLLGIREAPRDPGADRLALYERVRPGLSPAARRWWDAHQPVIAAGPDGAGRLDRFIAGFRREHLARLTGPGVVDTLLATDDPGARTRLADAALFTPAFARAFRAYFARDAIAERGRDPAQFRYVAEPDVAGWFLRRLRWACTELPVRGNFYLERFLRGGLRDADAGPPYLRRAAYERLRALAPRVEVVTEALGTYLASRPAASLHGLALSDVFEYLPPDASDALFAHAARVLRPRGRLAYWHLFVERTPPPAVRPRLRPLDRLSRALWRRDRAWLYGSFRVDEGVAA
jgi:S-adenosylmethionine-diacylglycerol 3-amino-3-carboxypropyl transferase